MDTVQPGWSALLWFGAIVALIPLVLWLLKRTPLGAAGSGVAGTPRTVAVLPVGHQQKVLTVEVGQGDDRLWLVLGVTPQGIRTLHAMAPQQGTGLAAGGASGAAPQKAAFAQLLSRLRNDGADRAHR